MVLSQTTVLLTTIPYLDTPMLLKNWSEKVGCDAATVGATLRRNAEHARFFPPRSHLLKSGGMTRHSDSALGASSSNLDVDTLSHKHLFTFSASYAPKYVRTIPKPEVASERVKTSVILPISF